MQCYTDTLFVKQKYIQCTQCDNRHGDIFIDCLYIDENCTIFYFNSLCLQMTVLFVYITFHSVYTVYILQNKSDNGLILHYYLNHCNDNDVIIIYKSCLGGTEDLTQIAVNILFT